jgi:arginyl-tRNA synthetase
VDLFLAVRQSLIEILENQQAKGALPEGLRFEAVEVTLPKDPSHGDMATNAAMVLASQAKMNPRAIADLLVPELKKVPHVTSVEIAGPGFINLRLAAAFWQQLISAILQEGIGYGNSEIGAGKKVNIEYVSANPTGPMHVGHTRGAVYGDALACLMLKAGYDVTKEYYINDAGAQTNVLAESAYLRYREALGEEIGTIPEGLYPGEYLKSVGEALAQTQGSHLRDLPKEQWLPIVRQFAIDSMMVLIRDDLAALGIQHDVFSSEAAITAAGKVEEAIQVLEGKGLVYTGVLEPPKGKTPEDWEPRPQTLFKSTEFGDDCDRALKKSDGSWTYFAPDVAYHHDKILRGHEILINILGADHGGYVKRLKAAVHAFSGGSVEMDVKLCQLVKLMKGGEPFKMSKRAGNFVTARDVIDEVGKDVVRFIMLTRKNDAPLEFDLEKVTEQSRENPVFYVQYAHARARSVERNMNEQLPHAARKARHPDEEITELLSHPAELQLLRLLATWPRMVEGAARAHEPHRIAFYLQDVAAEFHGLWNLGNQEPDLRFIQPENILLSAARLSLALAVATVIASGLMVLGVEPMEEMR